MLRLQAVEYGCPCVLIWERHHTHQAQHASRASGKSSVCTIHNTIVQPPGPNNTGRYSHHGFRQDERQGQPYHPSYCNLETVGLIKALHSRDIPTDSHFGMYLEDADTPNGQPIEKTAQEERLVQEVQRPPMAYAGPRHRGRRTNSGRM